MTWREFKRIVEQCGVRDDDVVRYIDVKGDDPIACVPVCRDENGVGQFWIENGIGGGL